MKLKKKIGGEKMENIKGKIFAGIGIVVVIAVFLYNLLVIILSRIYLLY